MTDQLSALAVQNAPLLRALQQGPASGPSELAQRAGIVANHVHRKLDALEGEGLIVRDVEGPKHVATLTDTAERALRAVQAFEGAPIPQGQGRALIPVRLIDAWAGNPRTQFDPASDEEMAQTVADKGVLQAIIVRPKGDRFEVIIGERRRRGSTLAVERGWQPPTFAVPCEIRELSDDEALEIAGVENLQREDMHWMDEATWYLRLAQRLSGPQIERLVGGQRKKRSIQDYIKIARELSADDIARTYLDEKHPNYLPYVRARDLVGDKKERPALDLTPKLKLTLLELIAASEGNALQVGATLETSLHAAPVGGPMGTLASDRKLIAFGFNGSKSVVCRIKITDEIAKYLTQLGWMDDCAAALRAAREAVIGEMQTQLLAADEYVTLELNAPKARPAEPQIAFIDPAPAEHPSSPGPPPVLPDLEDEPEYEDDDDGELTPTVHQAPEPDEEQFTPAQRRILREIAARSIHKSRLVDDYVPADPIADADPDFQHLLARGFAIQRAHSTGFQVALTLHARDYLRRHNIIPEAKSANSCATPWLRTDLVAETAAGPASALPAALDPAALPPMLQIVLIELAHRIASQGIERGPGTWATEVLANYYKDTRGMTLVQSHRMIAFMPMGHKTLAAVTKRGGEWLQEHAAAGVTAAGQPILSDAALLALQRELGFSPEAGVYATPWLNDPAPEPALGNEVEQTQPAPPAAAPASSPAPAGRDEFARQILAVTAESRALGRMAGALREARIALGSAKTRKLTAQEVAKLHALIDSALEASAPHVNEPFANV